MGEKTKNAVIIVAGGSGKRMQSSLPKQFLRVNDKPVLFHTLERFFAYDTNLHITLVLPPSQITYWEQLTQEEKFFVPHNVVSGGSERFHSVKNGLDSLESESGINLVAIHDGVRPLISRELITRCFQTAERLGNAIPAISPTETVRYGTPNANRLLDRNSTFLIQTPQVFRYEMLVQAYKTHFSPAFTDDASVVESLGVKIHLVDGERTNIKITSPSDLSLCAFLLKEQCC